MSSDLQNQKVNTLFIGIGAHPYDKLLSVIDNPLTYETLIKHKFDKIIFQCPQQIQLNSDYQFRNVSPHVEDEIIVECLQAYLGTTHQSSFDYFKPLFHKPYENKIKVEVYGVEFPSDLFLYKSDVAITSCERTTFQKYLWPPQEAPRQYTKQVFRRNEEIEQNVGVLLESHLVKINLIVVIEDTNSISYEIFTNLKEKPNVLGIKGAETITNELLDQYLTIKRDIQEVLKGGHKIPGEEYRPKKSDEKFQRQLMLLKQSLTEQNERYKNQDRHFATEHEIFKNNLQLQLEYLTFAFDSKKLNLNLVRHPQFQHLEPLLMKNDFFTFQREVFNDIKIEDDGLDFVDDDDFQDAHQGNGLVNGAQKKSKSRPFRSDGSGNENGEENDDDDAKSNNSFDSFNSNQIDRKQKEQQGRIGAKSEINEYTQPKADENEEDYFLRIKKNYNPYFYLDNQVLLDEEDEEEEEFKDGEQQNSENDGLNQNKVNKLGKTIKKQKLTYQQKVSKNKKLFNLDYGQIDPQQILKIQDPQRAQEVHIKKIERTNNELDELMSSIEKKEVIQMIKDEYEAKIIKGSYRICNCPYCKRLMVPFLVRKDFEDCHQEINDMVLHKHKDYFEKVKQRYQINDINIEQINNIFFREYKTNYISVTVEPEKYNQQGSSSPSSEANNDSPIKSKTNTSLRSKKNKQPSSILRNREIEEENEIEVEVDEEGEEDDMNGQEEMVEE